MSVSQHTKCQVPESSSPKWNIIYVTFVLFFSYGKSKCRVAKTAWTGRTFINIMIWNDMWRDRRLYPCRPALSCIYPACVGVCVCVCESREQSRAEQRTRSIPLSLHSRNSGLNYLWYKHKLVWNTNRDSAMSNIFIYTPSCPITQDISPRC